MSTFKLSKKMKNSFPMSKIGGQFVYKARIETDAAKSGLVKATRSRASHRYFVINFETCCFETVGVD